MSLFSQTESFIESTATQRPGEYRMWAEGDVTLYASCFAAMSLNYIGALTTNQSARTDWVDYINSWQDPKTGLFVGPELRDVDLSNNTHDLEHLKLHLTCQAIPALTALGEKPAGNIEFAHRFTERKYLLQWLKTRDWKRAWLEGNNLLFVGQLLIYLRDKESHPDAQSALDCYFEWLDFELDKNTNLWGTNGYCTNFHAMCGGYHQLLCYYHEGRNLANPAGLIDTVLPLQHWDGGFSPNGGGGACEDVDAVDILVNMYKLINYRRPEIRTALRRALSSILRSQMPDGGFVYRRNEEFVHMGIPKTRTPRNRSNVFATWFRVHTIALISQILTDNEFGRLDWRFNEDCSMGWHRARPERLRISFSDRREEWRQQSLKEIIISLLGPRAENTLRSTIKRFSA